MYLLMKFKNSTDEFVEFVHKYPSHWYAKLILTGRSAHVRDELLADLAVQFNWFNES